MPAAAGPRKATMGFYEEWILPALIDLSMRNRRLRPYRQRVAGAAEGRVLDVGVGSGCHIPFWMRFSGGCHLNRKIDDLLADAGFRIDRLETGYIPGPRIMTFFYEGAARPR